MEESSQTADPDGFYSTTSGTYKEAQPVVAKNVPSAHTVKTETLAAPEDVYSTPSGVYKEAQLVKPSNVPINKTVMLRAETTAAPEDYYSTTSGIYEEGEPVQPSNLLSCQSVKTETVTAPEDVYSTPSGIYEEAQSVQPSNVSNNQIVTLRTETAATPEDVYSTPSGAYEDSELVVICDVVPGQAVRGGTAMTGQNRSIERAADHTGSSSADRSEEQPAHPDWIRPFLYHRKGLCVVIMSCFAVAAMLFGMFIGETTKTRPHLVTLQTATTNMPRSLSERPWRLLTGTAALVTAVLESTHTDAISNKTGGLVPTTSAYKVVHIPSSTDETKAVEGSRQNVTFGGKGSEPGQFACPTGVVVSSKNEIFVADHDNRRVQVFSMEGAYLRHFPTTVPGMAGQMLSPEDIAMDGQNNLWLVGAAVFAGDFVVRYSRYGQGLSMFSIQQDGRFGGIAVNRRNGHVVVTRPHSEKVLIFLPDGSLIGVFSKKMLVSRYVTYNIDGNIVMSSNGFVHVYNMAGQLLIRFAGPGGSHGAIMNAMGICTDRSGHVLVADHQHKRVSMFTSNGVLVCHVATGLKAGMYVAVGPNEQLVVIDADDETVTVYPSY